MNLDGDLGLNTLRRLKSLCKMLRDDADKILTGEMGITISSKTLHELNEAVDNLQNGLSPPHLSLHIDGSGQAGSRASDLEEWNFHLQLVLDIISKAPILVLYKGKECGETTLTSQPELSAPVSQPVRLGYFTSLSHLEISYVPIPSIQDLLKMRERLQTLVVVNCFSTNFRLQNVLEMCDQEVSVPMQWAALKRLCLRCNNLTELDGSLRLCPQLEMLDLSRNRLPTTEIYLGYLMELTYVNLSYNNLTVLPAFSATAKKKLRVLLLTGNRLFHLYGVEEMLNLEELDVSENLISSHRCLVPIRALHRLDKLNMNGCPASMRKNHRLLTLQHVSTVSLSRKFSLDNHHVTHKEIQNSRAAMIHRQYISTQRDTRTVDHTDGPSQMINNHGDQQSTTEDLAVNSIPVRKKKGHKKAKARVTEIPDMDTLTSGEFSSRDITPSGTPKAPSRMEALAQLRRLEVQEKKAEMEHLRRYYGDSWLQAVEDQAVLPRPVSTAADSVPESAVKLPNGKKPAGRDSMTVVVEMHNSTAEKSELQPAVNWNSAEDDRGVGDSEAGAFRKDTTFLSSESGAEDWGTGDVPAQASATLQPSSDDLHTDDDSRKTEETLLSVGSQLVAGRNGSKVEESGRHATAENGEDSLNMWVSQQDSMVEPEDQSDPFIVTRPDNPDDHLIVTVSPRYLVEKDINGVIQDKLDLQTLQSVRVEVEEAKGQSQEVEGMDDTADISLKEVKVSLDFSYVRKDRKHRVYVMEDFITAQHFTELVQPFVDARVEAAMKKLQVQYQCLKCSSQFTKGQAHTVIHREDIAHTGSSKDFKSMADTGGGKVVLQCPKCNSDHVVQLETGVEHSHTTATSSLPADSVHHNSFGRKLSFDQLLASQSPKAHSTPLKQHTSSSDTQFTRSLERRGSKPRAFRTLFGMDDQDHRQFGDGPDPTLAFKPSVSAPLKQEGENLPQGRERSNAFHNQPSPMESRLRSNAFSSPAEFLGRQSERSSGSVLSHGSDVERTRSSASNSLTSVDAADILQHATSRASSNLLLAASSNSGTLTEVRTTVSSADSDVSSLNKHESAASVVVLSSTASADEMLQTDTVSTNGGEISSGQTCKTLHSEGGDEELDLHNVDHLLAAERSKLTPVQQELDNAEVTPIGSPLSGSICSSMVSSVYYNSLPPVTSASSEYVTASDHSLTREGENTSGEGVEAENETSIYDQAEGTIRSKSPHKVSVSSEVEVLLVEESQEGRQVWETEEGGEASQVSPAPTADTDEVAATVVSRDGPVCGSTGYDFKHIDHRMALYLMMSVFDNSEEFKFKVETCVCQYMMDEEYEALVVVTNMKLYILRINTEDISVELSEGLTLMEAQPHAELKRVEVGLGSQTLRLEYISDCSSYTLLLRDCQKVDIFKELLSDHLQMYAKDTGIPMSVVVNEAADPQTLDNLAADVLTRRGQTDSLRLYILGYIARGHRSCHPMAFVISSSEVCLVKTNHQWPSPHQQAPVTTDTVGKQFTVLERQKINNVATLEVHEENKCRLRITFFNESSGDETQWLVTMESVAGVMAMIEAVRGPWEEAFGVEMDVEVSAFELSL